MTHPLNTGTWRWDPACATWVFELEAAPGQPLIDAMAACARRMLAALPGFAIPATAEWTTESGGEDAVVQGRGTQIDEAAIAASFRAHRDVIQLALDLDLQLVDPSGRESVLEDGARLHVEREDALLVLWLDLNVDLYARRTHGTVRDNDRLAHLNGPRLAAFLERLAALTGAQLRGVDAPSYADQVSERGFELPPS